MLLSECLLKEHGADRADRLAEDFSGFANPARFKTSPTGKPFILKPPDCIEIPSISL